MRQRAEMPVQREPAIALTTHDMLKYSAYNTIQPGHVGAMGSPVYANKPLSYLPQRPIIPQSGSLCAFIAN